MDLPHVTLPIRFGNYVEQDSDDEIATCVEAITRCELGFREEAPEFGIPSRLFDMAPLDYESIRSAIEEQEPRASVDVSGSTDLVDEAVQRLEVNIRPEQR